jgi:hypothetical protein
MSITERKKWSCSPHLIEMWCVFSSFIAFFPFQLFTLGFHAFWLWCVLRLIQSEQMHFSVITKPPPVVAYVFQLNEQEEHTHDANEGFCFKILLKMYMSKRNCLLWLF